MKLNDPYLPPDSHMIVRDSSEAHRYAEAFGLTDQVLLASRLPEPAVFVTEKKHPTHWIVVGVFRGFAVEGDNGMDFMAFPKNLFSLDRIQNILRNYLGSQHRLEIETDSEQERPGDRSTRA
jgi:hypothetical protein